MSPSSWTDADTERAKEFWAEYQRQHDVSSLHGQAVGIDPVSGRVWFAKSAKDIYFQMQAEGNVTPFYAVRVGYDYYVRKGDKILIGTKLLHKHLLEMDFPAQTVRLDRVV